MEEPLSPGAARHEALTKMIFMSLFDRNVQKYASLHKRIQLICDSLTVSDDGLRNVMALFLRGMQEGLSGKIQNPTIKMLPTFVRAVPNGKETGKYLALDLGGTNFRVLLITLEGDGKSDMKGTTYRIPQSIMIGTGEQLFDHIASCLSKFIKDEELEDHSELPLGFTFSFPCKQNGLVKGTLINWTKGFKASGVEGQDIVQLLNDACARRGDCAVGVVALLNDTVGTLMSCALEANSCEIGVIVGTGTNACYLEKLDRCPKVEASGKGPDEMIINTEWGAFGDDGSLDFVFTEFDEEIDRGSVNPGQQKFEKMISGMYMGELVRLILVKMASQGLIFDGVVSEELNTKGKFFTKYVSEIEADMTAESETRNFQRTFDILEDLGIDNLTAADCANVAFVCEKVSTRAAHLCAAGIATLLNRMQKPFVTVGVDGSVYRFHPSFKNLLEQKIAELIDPKLRFQLMLSEDGSGRGAALVAAVQTRIDMERLGKEMASTAAFTIMKELSLEGSTS